MNVSTKLLVQISANTAQFVAGLNKANKSMGLMQKSLVSLKNTLVGTFGAYAVINGIQEAVKTLAEFDKVMTQVSVITGSGKTTEGFNRLEQSALRLGSTTQYTAKQVAELQLEFGRLGFSTKEILQSTEATVNLATATGEGLARSAEIAGSTLRAFNLDASEMGRVTDVMAAALNNSALTLDSFADGIKYVSPVAAAVNVSLEETAAMMSVLADAGIKGTQAGTSLRRIFTMLTNDGKPLQERLDALAKAGINLAAANDEVGLYAQTALLVLTKYKPKIDELTIAYQNAKGETEKMARAMEDNLATAITKVGTAYDALILSLRSSNGVLKDGATTIASILRTFASPDISGLQKYALLIGSIANPAMVGQFNNLSKAIENLNKVRDDATANKDQLIEDSAIVLLKDYGHSINDVNLALAGNENAEAIRLRYLELAKQSLVQQTQAIVEQAKAQDELNKEYEEAIKLASQLGNEENQRMLDKAAMRDFNIAKPGIAAKQNKEILSGGTNLKDVFGDMRSGQMDTFYDKIHKLRKEYQELNINQAEFLGMGVEQWAYFGNRVGDSIGRIIGKEESLAVAMAKTSQSIIDSIQNIILANIARGASVAFAKNPILGAAVVGIGAGVAKGLLNLIGRNKTTPNTNFGGGRYDSLNFAPVTFRQRGTDLIGVISETDRLNSRTRG